MVSGITLDQDGNVYAAVRCKDAPICKFDKEGNFLGSLGKDMPVTRLHGLSIAGDHSLWAADDGNHVIHHIAQDGTYLGHLGILNQPSDTGYDPSWVDPSDYTKPTLITFIDENGAQCQKLVSNSCYLSIKRMGAPFNKPTMLMETSDGRLVASDGYVKSAMHLFDKDGRLIKSWGGPGRRPGEMYIPHAFWIDPEDRIWLCDRENERLQVFDLEGNLFKVIDGLCYPQAIWGDGVNVYTAGDGRLNIYDLDYHLVGQIGYWHDTSLIAHSMCGDRNGSLFIADLGINSIYKLERIH